MLTTESHTMATSLTEFQNKHIVLLTYIIEYNRLSDAFKPIRMLETASLIIFIYIIVDVIHLDAPDVV